MRWFENLQFDAVNDTKILDGAHLLMRHVDIKGIDLPSTQHGDKTRAGVGKKMVQDGAERHRRCLVRLAICVADHDTAHAWLLAAQAALALAAQRRIIAVNALDIRDVDNVRRHAVRGNVDAAVDRPSADFVVIELCRNNHFLISFTFSFAMKKTNNFVRPGNVTRRPFYFL